MSCEISIGSSPYTMRRYGCPWRYWKLEEGDQDRLQHFSPLKLWQKNALHLGSSPPMWISPVEEQASCHTECINLWLGGYRQTSQKLIVLCFQFGCPASIGIVNELLHSVWTLRWTLKQSSCNTNFTVNWRTCTNIEIHCDASCNFCVNFEVKFLHSYKVHCEISCIPYSI